LYNFIFNSHLIIIPYYTLTNNNQSRIENHIDNVKCYLSYLDKYQANTV
jgi:hypothetical protein